MNVLRLRGTQVIERVVKQVNNIEKKFAENYYFYLIYLQNEVGGYFDVEK